MKYPHWQYFLILESDFIYTTRYVEIVEDNYETYSIEYVKLLLSTCSEIDVIFKLLCSQIDPSCDPTKMDIKNYQKIVMQKYPNFPLVKCLIPKYELILYPWQEWGEVGKKITWWHSYNNVKHERDHHYREANLENTLKALSGLFCLLLYYYKSQDANIWLQPNPEIFEYEGIPYRLVTEGTIMLPDFP